MLPVHRSLPSEAGLSTCLTKPPSFVLSKLWLRWLALVCVAVAVIWFGDLLSLVPSELLLRRPLDSHNSTTTTTNRFQLPSNIPPPPTKEEQDVWEPRKNEVRNAFKHAWSGYKNIAYPNDELLPLSGGQSNKYNGWGVTLFDSLDTLWIMGLRDEFSEAVDLIRDLQFHATRPDHFAGFFEVTIRYLGGTLSAYALSKDPSLLHHAERLGQMLLPAFHGTKTGVPAYSVNVETGEIRSDANADTVLFAEATTCQLEFKYLAKLTGNKDYYQKVEKAMDVFYRANVTDGLFHNQWSMEDGKPRGQHITIGATCDSGYEYLLKQWIQSGDPKARQQYIKSATGIINKLVYQTQNRGLLYPLDILHGSYNHRLEHLSCYLPGILALGAYTLPDTELPPKQKEIHRWAAHGLAYTCAVSYADQESGLGPDEIKMNGNNGRRWMEVVDEWEKSGGRQDGVLPPGMGEPGLEKDSSKRDYYGTYLNPYYLRPETVESIFIMWRTTGDVKWRERGYGIFQAIEKHTRTRFGYTTVRGIDGRHVDQLDDMPSWFLAETLKYLYLLFEDTNSFKLDEWVFNTEAHPLPIFSWTAKEREAFGIL